MPPTLKTATEKLQIMVLVPWLKGSPYRSIDTFWKKLRSFCRITGVNAEVRGAYFKERVLLM